MALCDTKKGCAIMFKIKNSKIENNRLIITDYNNKNYQISINDSKIISLLGMASNRSRSINKNIKYMNKYFMIASICAIICAGGASIPVILGKYYAEVFLIMYGGLSIASIFLSVISKVYIKWLKKYSVSNEYWEQIYDLMIDNNYNVNSNRYVSIQNKTYSNKREIYNSKVNSDKSDAYSYSNNTYDCTYNYKKSDIIQDKVKTYKRY